MGGRRVVFVSVLGSLMFFLYCGESYCARPHSVTGAEYNYRWRVGGSRVRGGE